jgi:hypothetical protein
MGKAGEKDAAAPQQAGHHRHLSRTTALQPQPAHSRHATQKKPADSERKRDLGDAPAKLPGKGDTKYAPRVRGAQGHLQADTGNGYSSPIHI